VLDDSRKLHYEVNKSYSAAIRSDNNRAMMMMRRRGRVPISREVVYVYIGTGDVEKMSVFLKEYRRHQYTDCLREAQAKKQAVMVTFMEMTRHDRQMWTEF